MRKLFLVFLPVLLYLPKEKNDYDTIIRHAQVYDGSGGDAISADIGIIADTIAFVGDLEHASAKTDVNGRGLILSPGFIDTHSHHAGGLFEHRDLLAAVSQGLTTIVTGQDGESNFPLATFFQQVSDTPVAINIGSYCGHNTIRDIVLAKDFKRVATAGEIEQMKLMLRQDMQAGALGLSTGLEYDPGIYSSNDEVLQLAKEVAPYGGRYISHIRSEDRYFWKAIDEIINIGKVANIPVQISHIKLAMHNLWGKSDSLLALLDNARKTGVKVTSDIYPYAFWHSTIRVLFPGRNFSDEKEAETILTEITLPEDIILSSYEIQREYEGKSLATIARLENKTPARMLTELIARIEKFENENKRSCDEGILATSMDETDIKKLMSWPQANICSDGSSFGGHPRGFGAFTKVLGHYTGEEKTFTLQEAIYKMTGLSAEHMGMKRRGFIRKGYYADLVLFDSNKVSDKATVAEPHKISEGIEIVWVNGKQVFNHGKTTGIFPGAIIKRQ